jgi:hypothetical protein
VVTTPGADKKNSKCGVVKANHGLPVATGGWGKRSGVSPEAALDLLDCSKCRTHEVAASLVKSSKTPAQKRSEAKDQRDATLAKMNKTKKVKAKKEPKAPAEGKVRRGPKGGDAVARMKANVEEHAALAEKHGWVAKAWESGTQEWTCEATRSGETLKLIYRDGRTVWSRVVLSSGVEVRLRNSSNWRKHATGESKIKSDYTPRTQGGKKADRATIIKDDAPRKLPFNLDEDDDDTVIESLLSRTITWRKTIDRSLDSATLPARSRNCRITVHPKSGRRMISFHEHQGVSKEGGEMLGGERTVYLDKILKAR